MDGKKDIPAEETAPASQEVLSKLKEIREARGLSLKSIFETTRVGLVNLTAVENGEFNRLPPPVYARNFIRKYAQAVGIDEKPILDRYDSHLASMEPPQEETEVREPWPETGRRHRFLVRSLVAVIAAGVLVFAIFLYDQGGKPPSPAPVVESASPAQAVVPDPAQTTAVPSAPAQTAAVANNPTQATAVPSVPAQTAAVPSAPAQITASKPVPAPAPAPAAASILPPASSGKTYHLVIEARELTWIRIAEDQGPSHQILLKPGEKVERTASDYFQLDIGNAGGINLSFQGKPLGSIGTQGQVVHIRLPKKGSEKKSP
jgi:cytoskeleton protein RodZ